MEWREQCEWKLHAKGLQKVAQESSRKKPKLNNTSPPKKPKPNLLEKILNQIRDLAAILLHQL